MELSFGAQHAHSILFVRELRRRMSHDRHHAHHRKPRAPNPVPSPSLNDLEQSIEGATMLPSRRRSVSAYRAMEAASLGESFAPSVLKHAKIPAFKHHRLALYDHRVYGARFVGAHGQRFVTSCKDKFLRVYDTESSDNPADWPRPQAFPALGARWTITDFDISPDGRWLAYTSINHYVHLADLEHPEEPQVALEVSLPDGGRVHIWSIKWSHDGREIIVGTGASHMQCCGSIIVYDVHRERVVTAIPAHEDDVNTVCFLQTGERNLLLSGSDDAFVKMWDRRDLRTCQGGELHRACAAFVGHQYGLTCVSSKDDGRFFLSNGKDQYIKLWDARACTPTCDINSVRLPRRDPTFDYRMAKWPRVETQSECRDDAVMTYAGSHETLQTLIRAHFSPAHTTGQKYIYCGSSDGCCAIYDVLTGKPVKVLQWHDQPVRDVSWHPYNSLLTTGSWDKSVMVGATNALAEEDVE